MHSLKLGKFKCAQEATGSNEAAKMLVPAIRSKTLQSNNKISSTSLQKKSILYLIYEKKKSDNQKEKKNQGKKSEA